MTADCAAASQESKTSSLLVSKENATILFTDIQKSSELWSLDESRMLKALSAHEEQVQRLCTKHKGFIVKSIGDAFMIKFAELHQAVAFALQLQTELERTCPIWVLHPSIPSSSLTTLPPLLPAAATTVPESLAGRKIRLRIGIAEGAVFSKTAVIQDNQRVLDFFGNTVNTASRMESKVSQVGGVAVALADPARAQVVKQSLQSFSSSSPSSPVHFEIVETRVYEAECSSSMTPRLPDVRSGRLLSTAGAISKKSSTPPPPQTTRRKTSCFNINDLRGVEKTFVLVIAPVVTKPQQQQQHSLVFII